VRRTGVPIESAADVAARAASVGKPGLSDLGDDTQRLDLLLRVRFGLELHVEERELAQQRLAVHDQPAVLDPLQLESPAHFRRREQLGRRRQSCAGSVRTRYSPLDLLIYRAMELFRQRVARGGERLNRQREVNRRRRLGELWFCASVRHKAVQRVTLTLYVVLPSHGV
jgi:hypothetical protein